MAKPKGLRMRFSRALLSFHHSCRGADDHTTASAAAVAAAAHYRPAFCLSPLNPKAFDDDFPPPPLPSPIRLRPRMPPVVPLSGCGCRPSAARRGTPRYASAYDADADDLPLVRETPSYLWRSEEKWHVVARSDDSPRLKIDSDDGGAMFFHPPVAPASRLELRRRRRRNRRARATRGRASTSSADSGWFSSEDEENDEWDGNDDDDDADETATVVSSYRSLSAESSKAARMAAKGRLAAAEGKVGESFAVVKHSEDPRADFRRSMAEMVVEKEIFEAADLEQLLRCFLSLNARHHHAAIVAAFSDVWDALFRQAPAAPFPTVSYK